MAKRGGFPGGMGMPGNMNNLMKQAQKMQKQMEENQKALEEQEFTATAGGGAVEVTVTGKKEVTKVKLAEEVVRLVEEPNDFTYSYELEGSIEDKLNQIVQKIYGGKRVVLTANAQKQAKQLEDLGFGNCPICVAKTQYSLTDDQTKLGAPTDFEVTVRNLKISAGAGFIVALTGEIMTMPGLPKVPAAEKIDVDETGKITGLF